MFSRVLKPVATVAVQNGKHFSTSPQSNYKVAVVGASGGIGQPLSLLLKANPLVSHLSVYDVANVTPGVAVDLSHMNTPAKVTAHKGAETVDAAIKDANVIVVPAGVPRKPGMTRDDLFNVNASLIRDLAVSMSKNAPCAVLCIITNPVNSMVPIAAEVLKKAGVFDPNRVLGVTTLDLVRSAAFVGAINHCDSRCVNVPCIGGHSGVTIIPLLSQSQPPLKMSDQSKIQELTKRIQNAGTEVVKAKAGGGSATLSMAYAGHRIVDAVLRGFAGESNVVECAYVSSNVTEATYFANPLQFGPGGVEKNLGYGSLNAYEKELLKAALPELKKNIETGVDFVKKSK